MCCRISSNHIEVFSGVVLNLATLFLMIQVERWTPTHYGKQTVYVGDEEIAEEVKNLAPTLRSKDMKNKGKR